MRECSELASIQTYKPFDIVANRGQISPVHIILSGQCSIIQYLNMNVQHKHVLSLQSPKKMVKDATMSDFMDDDDVSAAAIASANDISGNSELNANEATMSDGTVRRSHFVEIGQFSVGSVFGLGEHMDDRAIIAKNTQVQCLLIPHYWLFEKKQNAGNIWQRTKIYLDFIIPSREEVFKNYLITKKWKSYKKQLIQNSKSRRLLINATKIQDIPIICRLDNTY